MARRTPLLPPATLIAALLFLPGLAAAETVLDIQVELRSLEMTAGDIKAVDLVAQDAPGFQVRVSARMAEQVANLTRANIGKEARLSICGDVIARPVIQEAITSGAMVIAPVPGERMQPYLMALTGQAPCPAKN